MDLTTIWLTVTGVATGVLGWFARELWNAVQQLKADLGKLEIRIGTDYVRYDRLQDSLKPIVTTLERIETVLSHKVDK